MIMIMQYARNASLDAFLKKFILAPHCNTLQHTVTRCNTLQHAATCCNTLQHAAIREKCITCLFSQNALFECMKLKHNCNAFFELSLNENYHDHNSHWILMTILIEFSLNSHDNCNAFSWSWEFSLNSHWMRIMSTGWPRLIGSPKLQIIFHKRATKYRSLLRKMTYKDKGSYEASPPCSMIMRMHCNYDEDARSLLQNTVSL